MTSQPSLSYDLMQSVKIYQRAFSEINMTDNRATKPDGTEFWCFTHLLL